MEEVSDDCRKRRISDTRETVPFMNRHKQRV